MTRILPTTPTTVKPLSSKLKTQKEPWWQPGQQVQQQEIKLQSKQGRGPRACAIHKERDEQGHKQRTQKL